MIEIGFIYKITPHNCEEFYIGSTTDMKIRERQHITDSKIHTSKVYIKIRECGGFVMKLLYEYECENEPELRMEEQRCIDIMKPTLNTNRAFTSEECYTENHKQYCKKYYETNRDVIIEQKKQYYESNRDWISDKSKIYYETNKDAILDKATQYYETNKDAMRDKATQYYEKNKDVIIDKTKQYYEKNKKKINEKINCGCGSIIVKCKLSRHTKSKKHQNWLETQ